MPPNEEKSFENDAKDNVWQNILNNVKSDGSQQKDKTMLVLGDQTSGKSSMLSKFTRRLVNEHSRRYVLDYSYIDVVSKDESQSDDVLSRLNIWQLNNEQHKDIACSMLGSLENLCVMITFDLSEPWNALSSIEKWMGVVESICETLSKNVSSDKIYDLKKDVSAHIQFYFDPSTAGENVRLSEQEKSEIAVQMENPKINFGIPIFIVGCKSDALQKRCDATQVTEKFEAMSFLLRKYCIKYGASLFYTSASGHGKNIDVVQEYITSRMFELEFEIPPKVVGMEELSSIFVPSGWDNDELIMASRRRGDEEKSDRELLDSYFSKPPKKNKNQKQEKKITGEKDHIFLKTLKFELDRANVVGAGGRRAGGIGRPSAIPRQPSAAKPSGSRSKAMGSNQRRPDLMRASTRPSLSGEKDNSVAVRNFFQSLLNSSKQPSGGGGGSAKSKSLQSDAARKALMESMKAPSKSKSDKK